MEESHRRNILCTSVVSMVSHLQVASLNTDVSKYIVNDANKEEKRECEFLLTIIQGDEWTLDVRIIGKFEPPLQLLGQGHFLRCYAC